MTFLKKNVSKIATAAYLTLLPAITFAQAGCNPAGGRICNPIPNVTTVNGFIHVLLEGVLKVGLPVVVLAVIYCGFLFVQARGNSEKITKAKDALLYTLIGAAILLGSWAIAELIQATITGLS